MKWLSIILLGVVSCSGNPQGCSNTILFPNDDVWQSFPMPLFGTTIPGVAGPDPVQVTTDGSGSQGVYAACYSPTSDEHVFDGRIVSSDASLNYSAVTVIMWYAADATAGNVVWCQEFAQGVPGYDIDSNPSISSCITVVASGVQGQIQKSSFSQVDAVVPSRDVSALFHFSRDANIAADTYGDDACVLGIQIYYTADRAGLGVLP
jgi:hypothetical protein